MGQTVVFTVSLDADDVAIEQFAERPVRHVVRDAFLTAVRDRRWWLAALVVFAAPALAAGATALITRGAWATTSFLVVAGLATAASGAWAGAAAVKGPLDERLAAWLVTGVMGLALAVPSLPGIAVLAAVESWRTQGALATLAVLALTGGAAAWLGLFVANRWRPWTRVAAACAALALSLVPLGVAAALVPQTRVTEDVLTYSFVTDYAAGRPAYVCGAEEVETSRLHTENVAWIAFASPIAWVVDAPSFTVKELASAPDGSAAQSQAWTRSTRVGPDAFAGYCFQPTSLGPPTAVSEARYAAAGPVGASVAAVVAVVAGAAALVMAALVTAGARRRQSS